MVLLLAAPGCTLYHDRSDSDAMRYATAWEMPGVRQQPVLFTFRIEGECDDPAELRKTALDVLLHSGRFRLATPQDEPAYTIDMLCVLRRETHVFKTICNALILYALPVDVQDRVFEAVIYVRKPSGKLIEHCYAQGRGKATLWLGYVLWPSWLWNSETTEIIRRDTLKAAAVKACRALIPRASK